MMSYLGHDPIFIMRNYPTNEIGKQIVPTYIHSGAELLDNANTHTCIAHTCTRIHTHTHMYTVEPNNQK